MQIKQAFCCWRRLGQLCFLLVVATSSGIGQAAVSFRFTGELTQVDSPLAGVFNVGDSYSGRYTFDETSYDPDGDFFGFAYFDSAISDLSVNFNGYHVSASNGSISQEFDDFRDYQINVSPLFGLNVNGLDPESLAAGWTVGSTDLAPEDFVFTVSTPLTHPLFSEHLPPWQIYHYSNYYDADGNLVFDSFTGNVIGDPDLNQPFYEEDGTLASTEHSWLLLTFSNGEQSVSLRGNLSSVTVVPLPAGVWLLGTALAGLFVVSGKSRRSRG